jgi:hypothetical protein
VALGRADVVAGIVRIGLEELSRTGLTTKEIDRLQTFMADQAALIASGSAWDLPSFASSRTALTDRQPTRKRGDHEARARLRLRGRPARGCSSACWRRCW